MIRLTQQEKWMKELEERLVRIKKTTVNEIVQVANVDLLQLAEIFDAARKGIFGAIPSIHDGADTEKSNEGNTSDDGGQDGTGPDGSGNGDDLEPNSADSPGDSLPGITDEMFIYPDDGGYYLFGKEEVWKSDRPAVNRPEKQSRHYKEIYVYAAAGWIQLSGCCFRARFMIYSSTMT